MVCLGVLVDSDHFTLSVTETRVKDLLSELSSWSSCESYTLKQLQSLLGKLSFVTACVKPGRTFMSRLLNSLRAFPSTRARLPVSGDMKADIAWWLDFLPIFNGTSLIKPLHWKFDNLQFNGRIIACWRSDLSKRMFHVRVSRGHRAQCRAYHRFRTLHYCCCCQVLGFQAFPPQIPCVM